MFYMHKTNNTLSPSQIPSLLQPVSVKACRLIITFTNRAGHIHKVTIAWPTWNQGLITEGGEVTEEEVETTESAVTEVSFFLFQYSRQTVRICNGCEYSG